MKHDSEKFKSQNPHRVPDVFEFVDYREFVKVSIEYLKTREDFSFRKWAKKAGIPSPGLVFLIIKDKTGISEKTALRLAKGFELSVAQTKFFLLLVRHKQARFTYEQESLEEEIKLQKQLRQSRPLEKTYYDNLKKWLLCRTEGVLSQSDLNFLPQVESDNGELILTCDDQGLETIKNRLHQFRMDIFKEYGESKIHHDQVIQMKLQITSLLKLKN